MSTELFNTPLSAIKPGQVVVWHIRLGTEEQKELFALAKHHYQAKETITMQDVGELLADLTRAVVTLSYNKMHKGFPVEPKGGFAE